MMLIILHVLTVQDLEIMNVDWSLIAGEDMTSFLLETLRNSTTSTSNAKWRVCIACLLLHAGHTKGGDKMQRKFRESLVTIWDKVRPTRMRSDRPGCSHEEEAFPTSSWSPVVVRLKSGGSLVEVCIISSYVSSQPDVFMESGCSPVEVRGKSGWSLACIRMLSRGLVTVRVRTRRGVARHWFRHSCRYMNVAHCSHLL